MSDLAGQLHESSRRRLEPQPKGDIAPFVRAGEIDDCALYWIGVREFPMLPFQRDWLLAFAERLAARLRMDAGLREECFFANKAINEHNTALFSRRAGTYVPLAGMMLVPGTTPTQLPDFENIKKVVGQASKDGAPVDVKQWMPDLAHWFLVKNATAQRSDFFGLGGMFSLFLPPDPTARKPLPALPRLFTSHPAYNPELHRQYEMAQSLEDPFLARSKELFGEPFAADPSFPGLPFILPLLTSASVLAATADERARWFTLFDAYCIESPRDGGMLLLCKDPEFDIVLSEIVERMRDDQLVYRH